MNKLIAVSGASGQQGGSVTKALLKQGFRVRALTRKINSPAAEALRVSGAETVYADLNDAISLDAALRGVDGFFLVTSFFETNTEIETTQGITGVQAAKRAKLPFTVFSSVSDADRNTGIPHFDSKYRVEMALAKASFPHAVVAPTFFFENFLTPFIAPFLKKGQLVQALPPDRKLQMVSLQSIGAMVARMFIDPGAFDGQRINIADDERTGEEIATILSQKIKRSIAYVPISLDVIRQQSEDMAKMYAWFDSVGYSADIETLRKSYSELPWTSLAQWADNVDWSSL